jgi:hypothetical protein
VASPAIPTWRERLSACFRWRHRLLHVVGVPSAIGALASVGGASLLNPDTGLALGALVAGLGTLLAGYYVTAGFDRKLVERLQAEKAASELALDAQNLTQIVWNAPQELRPVLERIVATHSAIDAVFSDAVDDAVERILEGSRADLRALRDRALKLVELYRRLGEVIQHSDGRRLYEEMNRLKGQLANLPAGPTRDAQLEAYSSAERTYAQWQAAVDKHRQVHSVLTVIEKNLEEFKLAMALRKAALVEGDSGATNVSELQARLAAAGEACDQLVGRPSGEARRSRRARAR